MRKEDEEFGVDAKALVDSRIQGNVVVADRVENLSSGIVFSKNNLIEAVRLNQDSLRSIFISDVYFRKPLEY